MSWLLPNRVHVERERLDAVLAENELARIRAEESAEVIDASVAADEEKLEAAREEIRRRSEERRERARRRAASDPGLSAVTEVLKLLETRK